VPLAARWADTVIARPDTGMATSGGPRGLRAAWRARPLVLALGARGDVFAAMAPGEPLELVPHPGLDDARAAAGRAPRVRTGAGTLVT